MFTLVQDSQDVPQSGLNTDGYGTLFEAIQGDVPVVIQFQNTGVATVNFKIQTYSGAAWTDVDNTSGSITTAATDVQTLTVQTGDPKIRFVANGNGTINFTVQRFYPRASQGSLPLLSL